MPEYLTKTLGVEPDGTAPDGSEARLLCRLTGGSMAHFRLPAGQVSRTVFHRTVEEIWYFLEGHGEMWRHQEGAPDEPVLVGVGTCLTIPLGVRFQFRADPDGPLAAVAVTMPPWPGRDEAVTCPDGYWPCTL